jgi:hypothetical protein
VEYKVVPFVAGVTRGDGANKAASQLETLTNELAGEGWTFCGLEEISTDVMTPAISSTPGSNGCLGIGATMGSPGRAEQHDSVAVNVAVFSK